MSADTKTRAPRAPGLTLPQRFEVQTLVRAAALDLPDATLAAQAAAKIGRDVAPSLIASYRKEFGLASVAKPTYEQLLVHTTALSNMLTDHGLTVPTIAESLRLFGRTTEGGAA